MIRKQDILDRAAEWQLRPEVVEKDYVLGWLLVGLASSPTRPQWVFKGGTCIKKCFFETYRFSEDLDFSLLPEAAYSEQELRALLVQLTRITHELSGIDFPADRIEVRTRQNKQGQQTFECRISYSGPLVFPGYPRVLIDITQHEPVLDHPEERKVFHPYPDALPDGSILTYTFDELLAEKTRALFERARPRDLYDVVYLLENRPEAFDFPHVQELFNGKCESKGLTAPTLAEVLALVERDEELRSEWNNMLAHQLPVLPELAAILARLPGLLHWLEEPTAVLPVVALPAAPAPADTEVLAPAGIQFWGGGVPLETLRFAGANRLLVEFYYDGKHRLVEPYSLRQARTTGNILLYGWEQGSTHIKAFNVAKIQGLRPTTTNFAPRYRVEFTAAGQSSVPLSAPGPGPRISSGRRSSTSSRTRAYGPTYTFACPYCQKRFRRSTSDSRLGKHKTPAGWDCPGRTGYLVSIG